MTTRHPGRLTILGGIVALMLATWTVYRFGGFNLTTTVTDGNGGGIRIPNTFASVDHPFHAARADMLLDRLRDGELLRWVGAHHGGYPVEFYPIGIAWLDVLLWAATLGQFPIEAVHKLTVLVVFVLPVIGFWILARGDRLNPFVPVLGLAVQIATPGLWTSGGLIELVEWGLVANVGGAAFAFIGFAALARYTFEGERLLAATAMLCLAGAMYANSRASIPIAVGTVALIFALGLSAAPWARDDDNPGLGVGIRRIALVGGVSGLLAAPLIGAMLRYQDLYYFANYNEYADIADYWEQTLNGVSRPMVMLAGAGIAVSLVLARLRLMRAIGVTLVLYALLTMTLAGNALDEGLIQQLESPRLMPFQRLLVIYLGVAFAGWAIGQLARFLPMWSDAFTAAVLVVASVFAISTYPGDFGVVPQDLVTHENSTADYSTTGYSEFAQFEAAVSEAGEITPPGQAIYVIGDQKSWWHEQLWGTTFADAPFYYDDWMWYWHEEPTDRCNTNGGHYVSKPATTLNREFFQAHGIGVVVVTNMQTGTCGTQDPRLAALNNPDLEPVLSVGYWDLYRVRDPRSIVSNGETEPVRTMIGNGVIEAEFENAGGTVTVRHNWFPRWKAWADGEPVAISELENGFMELDVPQGTSHIELRYGVTTLDWMARIAAGAGVAATIGTLAGLDRRLRRLASGRPGKPRPA